MNYREWKNRDGFCYKDWMDKEGNLDRKDGPARTIVAPDGLIQWEQFYLNGALHRDRGPACIGYYNDGSAVSEDFYLHGEYLGTDNEGFWNLWERLTEEQRRATEILKCLSRFS